MKSQSVKELNKEPFAIVPQELLATKQFTPSEKLIISFLLAKYRTTLSNGEPWTFSVASIIEGTSMERRAVEKIVKTLNKVKILKDYGIKKQAFGAGRPINLFTFNQNALNNLMRISATDTTIVLVNDNADKSNIEALPRNQLAPELAPELAPGGPNRSKILKERVLEVSKKEDISNGKPDLKLWTETLSDKNFFVSSKDIQSASVPNECDNNSGCIVSSPFIQTSGSGANNQNENKICVGVGFSLQRSETTPENNEVLSSSIAMVQGSGVMPSKSNQARSLMPSSNKKRMSGAVSKVSSAPFGGFDSVITPKDNSKQILERLVNVFTRWKAMLPPAVYEKRQSAIIAQMGSFTEVWHADDSIIKLRDLN